MAAEDIVLTAGLEVSRESSDTLANTVAAAVSKGVQKGLKALDEASTSSKATPTDRLLLRTAQKGLIDEALRDPSLSNKQQLKLLGHQFWATEDINQVKRDIRTSGRIAQTIQNASAGVMSLSEQLSLRATAARGANKASSALALARDESLPLETRLKYARSGVSASEAALLAARQVGDEEGIKLNRENLKELSKLNKSLNTLSKTIKPAFATALVSGSRLISEIYPSVWRERITRDVIASRQAEIERTGMLAQAGGSLIGGVVGGMVGGTPGALVGSAAGDMLGKLAGQALSTSFESQLKTRDAALAMRRDMYMYGGKSGYALGQGLQNAGMAQASSLDKMRWTAETLPGAMALGMVGEQDMFMLSMMPEYFAALMSGSDAQTLATAYKKSVDNLPDAFKPLVASMAPGGSQDMYAASRDPNFMRVVNAGELRDLETVGRAFSHGYAYSAAENVGINAGKAIDAMKQDTLELLKSKDGWQLYNTRYLGREAQTADAFARSQYIEGFSDVDTNINSLLKHEETVAAAMDTIRTAVKRSFEINVNLDGVTVGNTTATLEDSSTSIEAVLTGGFGG